MLGRIVAIISVVAGGLLVGALHSTNPTTTGPLGILFVFILMYLSTLGALTFLIHKGHQAAAKLVIYSKLSRPLTHLSLGRSYYYASVVALAPVIFIGMQSVGEVGIYDILLILLFIVIACVYITKRTH